MKFQYFTNVENLLKEVFEKEQKNLEKSVNVIVDAIENKHAIFTFGASHAGILSEEMYYRAGGLVVINPIFGRELMLDTSPITQTSRMERLEGYGRTLVEKTKMKQGDVVIVHSVSGRNPVSIDVALTAKEIGATVIGITNVSYSKEVMSRHSSNKNLYQICDIVLDNHGEKGDACVEIEGLPQKVSPTSTVVGATMLNAIVAEVVQTLVNHGLKTPPVFYSANVDGGDEKNKEIYEKYKGQIHYDF